MKKLDIYGNPIKQTNHNNEIKPITLCKCGHQRQAHAFGGEGECYSFNHLKGCYYQCVCRKFEINK